MKSRVTLSLEESTLNYLARRAEAETGGNVSALLERVVQAAAVAESAKLHAAWFTNRPGYADTAEAERYAA
ncbi:hypothetical protein [Catellatospora tritici]|uniref:hypothetical protein n=1 Tax=Catellatospora tritici TaxID=2851566 RepID=UPI001C2DD71B|nr:hypothetical protein [Catellatospora tritici]MBV1851881.1 hypothetical protein [Catellatospora tritici]